MAAEKKFAAFPYLHEEPKTTGAWKTVQGGVERRSNAAIL